MQRLLISYLWCIYSTDSSMSPQKDTYHMIPMIDIITA